MKYVLLLHDNEDNWAALEEAKRDGILASYEAYTKSLREAGAMIAAAPLDHSKNGKRVSKTTVQDGPFADGKEQLGGFYMLEAKNLDEALDWAAKCPCASYGFVEVRPVWNIGG